MAFSHLAEIDALQAFLMLSDSTTPFLNHSLARRDYLFLSVMLSHGGEGRPMNFSGAYPAFNTMMVD